MTGRCQVCGVPYEEHHAPNAQFKYCCCLPIPSPTPALEAAGVYQPSLNGKAVA